MDNSKNRSTRIAAYGLIHQQGKMLLCRLSSQLPRWTGQWTLPGGGIEFGEDPVDAMVREVNEETGLQVRALSVATVNSKFIQDERGSFHAIRIIYNAEVLGGSIRYEMNGTTDMCRWCSKQDIAEIELVELAEIGVKLAR